MNIGQFFALAAERHPDRPAFVHGNEVATYAQANDRINALAVGLRSLGLARGDRVGVLMWNSSQLIESFFAIWKAGCCAVPLNARFLANEVSYHLTDSQASAIIFGEEFRGMMNEIREHLFSVRHFICTGRPLDDQIAYQEMVSAHKRTKDALEDVREDDLAWLCYSSGTT